MDFRAGPDRTVRAHDNCHASEVSVSWILQRRVCVLFGRFPPFSTHGCVKYACWWGWVLLSVVVFVVFYDLVRSRFCRRRGEVCSDRGGQINRLGDVAFFFSRVFDALPPKTPQKRVPLLGGFPAHVLWEWRSGGRQLAPDVGMLGSVTASA